MRSIVEAAIVVTAVLLTACTTTDLGRSPWTKAEARVAELSLDDTVCRRAAARAPSTPESYVGGVADLARGFIEAAREDRAYEHCMRSLGYARAPAGG